MADIQSINETIIEDSCSKSLKLFGVYLGPVQSDNLSHTKYIRQYLSLWLDSTKCFLSRAVTRKSFFKTFFFVETTPRIFLELIVAFTVLI